MRKKNQHVVPYEKKWALRGEGNRKATVITSTKRKLIKWEGTLHEINALNYLSMAEMERFKIGIVLEMILVHQKIKNIKRVILGEMKSE